MDRVQRRFTCANAIRLMRRNFASDLNFEHLNVPLKHTEKLKDYTGLLFVMTAWKMHLYDVIWTWETLMMLGRVSRRTAETWQLPQSLWSLLNPWITVPIWCVVFEHNSNLYYINGYLVKDTAAAAGAIAALDLKVTRWVLVLPLCGTVPVDWVMPLRDSHQHWGLWVIYVLLVSVMLTVCVDVSTWRYC